MLVQYTLIDMKKIMQKPCKTAKEKLENRYTKSSFEIILDSKQDILGVCIMIWKKITNVILKCLHGEIMS